MMKKWLKSLTVIAAVALVIIPCVLFSACSSDHTPAAGDTYAYEKIEFQWNLPEGSEATEAEIKKQEEFVTNMYSSAKVVFTSKTEGELVINSEGSESKQAFTYTIADGKVTLSSEGSDEPMVATIKGETLVLKMEQKSGDVVMCTVNVTYKLSK